MTRDWKKFLEVVETDPKLFVRAIVETLCPPNYVKEKLQKFDWICSFCWNISIDECFLCEEKVCQDHLKKTFTGKKTKLKWYVCENCLKNFTKDEIQEMIKDEDESLSNEQL